MTLYCVVDLFVAYLGRFTTQLMKRALSLYGLTVSIHRIQVTRKLKANFKVEHSVYVLYSYKATAMKLKLNRPVSPALFKFRKFSVSITAEETRTIKVLEMMA